MDNLRRKIILSVPLFSIGGALVGCGEDDVAPSNLMGGERASAQAVSGSTGQSLRLSAINLWSKLDPIWDKSNYLVPDSTAPTITGCINGKGLYLSMSETIFAAKGVTITRSLMLSLSNGLTIKAGSQFAFDGKKRCNGVLTVLKRTATTEDFYAYGVVESTNAPGTVQLTKYSGENFTLKLNNLRLAAKGSSLAVKDMKLSGSTGFKGRQADANWM